MEVVNESQMMMKEVSQSSVSALDQRLLDLEIDIPLTQQHLSSPNSDTSSCQFQLRDETTVDLLSESISTATTTSASAYACASDPKRTSVSAPKAPPPVTQVYSDESELAVLEYRRPLRVVNRSDSQSSSGSDSESVYSRPSLAEDEDAEGLDLVEGRLPRLTFTSSASESESDVEVGEGLPVSVQDNVFCHFEGLPNPHGNLEDEEM
ncbi:hypothetical protein BT96DRAFT_657071 [Gymnopus androsaceus JB14]|uniref:Uncharacterized protein n=1 Tax=Gymnopus androsaceus JB14 TaxID=1447944 RepID=A0A6A4HQ98_9AGAR|nr:hypothetical protein BT96DRAFT_657071 [Gymnopus androsaceus JB14]